MNDIDQKLSKILEIEYEEVGEEVEIPTETISSEEIVGEIVPFKEHLPVPIDDEDLQQNLDIDYDYELSRETQRELMDKGSDALDGILKVAKESQHPRAYEVAATMLKNVSDITDKLMNLHEKKKQLKGGSKEPSSSSSQLNVERAVFIGSTSELLKRVKQENK